MSRSDDTLKPMLLRSSEPFDSPDYIYELKLDGIRCLAYIGSGGAKLISRSGREVTDLFPELDGLNGCAPPGTVLDGELVIMKGGKPDLYELLRRNRAKRRLPAEFAVFDALFLDGVSIMDEPLLRRKQLLAENVAEGGGVSVLKYIENDGKAFFELAKNHGLEGIVAKHKDSVYRSGARTSDWLKIKAVREEDYAVCGYIPDGNGEPYRIILGENDGGEWLYKGHINVSAYYRDKREIAALPRIPQPLFDAPDGEAIIWLRPDRLCAVRFLERMESGDLRHASWSGLRPRS